MDFESASVPLPAGVLEPPRRKPLRALATAMTRTLLRPDIPMARHQQRSRIVNRSSRVLALMLLACGSPSAQPPTAEVRASAIESQVALMRRDTATVFGLSAEGARLEAAYADTALRRLRAEFLGETGRATETFYFDSGLFLVTRRDFRYDAPLSGRVLDSSVESFDVRAPATSPAVADSLRAAASELLAHLRNR